VAVGSCVLTCSEEASLLGSCAVKGGVELLEILSPAQALSGSRANTTRKRAVIFFMTVHSFLGYCLSAMPENYLG